MDYLRKGIEVLVSETITPILEAQNKLIKAQEERIETLEKQVAEQNQKIQNQEKILENLQVPTLQVTESPGGSNQSSGQRPETQQVARISRKRRKPGYSSEWKSCIPILDRVWLKNYNISTYPRKMSPLPEDKAKAVLAECQKSDSPANRKTLHAEMVSARQRYLHRKYCLAYNRRKSERMKIQQAQVQARKDMDFLDGIFNE